MSPFAVIDPAGDCGSAKDGPDFGATLARLAVLEAVTGVMASARKRPHIVESPDNWHLKSADAADASNTTIDPVQVYDIGLEAINELTQTGALQAQ